VTRYVSPPVQTMQPATVAAPASPNEAILSRARLSQQGKRDGRVRAKAANGKETCAYVAKTPMAQPAEQTAAPAMERPHFAFALSLVFMRDNWDDVVEGVSWWDEQS